MAMLEPTETTSGVPMSEGPKLKLLPGQVDDDGCMTFVIRDEDHTLANSLRWMLMKNPAVTFCGYSIPHPSEAKVNIRVQTDGSITAVDAFDKGLCDLIDLTEHVKTTFVSKIEKLDYEVPDTMAITW